MTAPRPEGPPCRAACPVDKNVPGFLRAIARDDVDEAWRIAYRDNLFPGVLGWICPRPCESACRLAREGEAIAVCDLKRWVVGTHEPPRDLVPRPSGDGPDVAIVGAGPAGLAAAHDLAVRGARVTLFDRESQPGGLLTGCIPAFRLPPGVVAADIRRILSLGVEFRGGFTLAHVGQLARLRDRGYAAVLVALGAGDDVEPDVPGWARGESLDTAIAFLRDAAREGPALRGRRVVVVGGGNGAVDAARTALRAGAATVRIVYRRGRDAMPAFAREVAAAEAEGVQLVLHALPRAIRHDGGRVSGLECEPAQDGAGSRDRRLVPARGPGQAWIERADRIVFAIGQRHRGIAEEALPPGVFRTGPSGGTVVDAIATGRRAAAAVAGALARSGRWIAGPGVVPVEPPSAPVSHRAGTPRQARLPAAATVVPARMPRALAAREASRCLGCDRLLSLDADACILCGRCAQACAWNALAWSRAEGDAWRLSIDDDACRRCGDCVTHCPSRALGWSSWKHPNRFDPRRTEESVPSRVAISSSASAGRA